MADSGHTLAPRAKDKRAAAAKEADKEAELKLACIQKESKAQIAVAAATSVAAPGKLLEEDNDVMGEITPEVQTLPFALPVSRKTRS
ncbi:hypothetical protein MMC31_001380 [Peltigera leucophlebia]|nr:hypothetical protein [Peltigera leucophlebia]